MKELSKNIAIIKKWVFILQLISGHWNDKWFWYCKYMMISPTSNRDILSDEGILGGVHMETKDSSKCWDVANLWVHCFQLDCYLEAPEQFLLQNINIFAFFELIFRASWVFFEGKYHFTDISSVWSVLSPFWAPTTRQLL